MKADYKIILQKKELIRVIVWGLKFVSVMNIQKKYNLQIELQMKEFILVSIFCSTIKK